MSLLSNPFDLMKAAAKGDIDAQRALADHATASVREGDPDPIGTLREGLVFARLAAAQGDRCDRGRVLSMLGILGAFVSGTPEELGVEAESLALASLFADDGDEIAADGVNHAAAAVSPEVIEMAKLYQTCMKGAYQ